MNRSLFRYRKITEYSIKELIEESVTGSKRDCFNDYYDFRLCYDKQMILNLLNEQKRTIANMIQIISEKNRNIIISKDALSLSLDDFIDWLENIITSEYYIACFSKKNNREI